MPDSPQEGGGGGTALALSLSDVHHAYGRKVALDGVSFDVKRGRLTALLGPNGAGKTTLFGLITRLLGLRRGHIAICGTSITVGAAALKPLGLVFQQPTLDLDLTVRQNLRYFAALRGLSAKRTAQRIDDELTRLGMADRAGERVRSLNGGHRRRVELARALLHEPALLLLDEPTVGLDMEARTRIVDHVHSLAEERDMGVLWATHLIDEVREEDDLLVLSRGKIVAAGRADAVMRAAGADTIGAAFARLTHAPQAPPSVSAPGGSRAA